MIIESSSIFTPWIDPVSHIKSYILTKKAAPVQQSFYFTNPSMTKSGRYIWFYCAFPPSEVKSLGVVDLKEHTVSHFPETTFTDASPMVDIDSEDAFWCNASGIYKRSPNPNKATLLVAKLPQEITKRGLVTKIATHLNYSADKTELCFDCTVGRKFIVGSVNISTGKFIEWQEFDRLYNHAAFSPTDKDLMLICQDSWTEVDTGINHYIDYDEQGAIKRLWLIRRGEKAQYIKMRDKNGCHECFSSDGKYLYYVDWDNGMTRINTETGASELINTCITWHGYPSKDGSYQVGDNYPISEGFYRGTRCDVVFNNSVTQESVKIVTNMPALFTRENPSIYHNDPHPQFVYDDKYILYTTTVRGVIDLAVTSVADLLSR